MFTGATADRYLQPLCSSEPAETEAAARAICDLPSQSVAQLLASAVTELPQSLAELLGSSHGHPVQAAAARAIAHLSTGNTSDLIQEQTGQAVHDALLMSHASLVLAAVPSMPHQLAGLLGSSQPPVQAAAGAALRNLADSLGLEVAQLSDAARMLAANRRALSDISGMCAGLDIDVVKLLLVAVGCSLRGMPLDSGGCCAEERIWQVVARARASTSRCDEL